MCFGNQKKQHHANVERERYEAIQRGIAAQAARDRQLQIDRMTAMQAEADKRQQEALKMIAESSRQPIKVKTAADARTPIMRTKQKTSATGIASLRINRTPSTNIGISTSGTNIG
jgi:hypothetical protein